MAGCNIYLALCGGTSGHYHTGTLSNVSLSGALSSSTSKMFPHLTVDGFVTPVWIANLDCPIRWADKASLTVKHVADAHGSSSLFELQLRDGDNPVWRAAAGHTGTGVLEIRDSGDLLIHGSQKKTHVVWQGAQTDTLIEGQRLTVGKKLVSNDSSFEANMEEGGLVMKLKKAHSFGGPQELQSPLPYWVLPVFRDDQKSLHLSINQLISTAPCSNQSAASVHVVRHGIAPYNGSGADSRGHHYIALYPGPCSSRKSFIEISNGLDQYSVSWTFMRLETDGRLYSYVVFSPNGNAASFARIALDSAAAQFYADSKSFGFTPPFLEWKECNVPMACGPLGMCTPGAKTVCACSFESKYFEPVNLTDFSQGCKRLTPLPPCGVRNTHPGSTEFVKLESTASILLFSGWMLNSTRQAQADTCKQICLSDCLCKAFFYQVDTSMCFFIQDEISLMAVDDITLYSVNYTYGQDLTTSHNISAKNYVTYLKVTFLSQTTTHKAIPLVMVRRVHGPPPFYVPMIVVFTVSGILFGVAIYCFRERQKKRMYKSIQAKETEDLKDILPLLPYKFSFKELYDATHGFDKLLGTGGCGSVFAGVLADGRKVAVKLLQGVLQGTGQSKQFLAEVATVGRTGHHNIVRLVGFCWEATQRLLVYEYVERGSLDRWIFVKEAALSREETSAVAAPVLMLDWKMRYKIAKGIARGLSYLHEECEQPILHFDIKPQNILLGDDFEPKLADFGLSRLMQRDMSSVVTGVRGTLGYIAPEWFSHGAVGKKSDVYSMGMLFLEIVGGRKNLDYSLLNSSTDPKEQEAWNFPTWGAKMCEEGLVMELVDKKLHVCGFDGDEARRLIYIAFWCIHEDPAMRPYVPTVVQWLEGHSPIEQPPFSMVLNAKR